MNTDTGQLYETPADIEEAEERGEPLVHLSPSVYQQLTELQAELDGAWELVESYRHSYLLACGLPSEGLARLTTIRRARQKAEGDR